MGELVTATILFTDLVGSTEIRSRLGDDAADAIHARVEERTRQAVTASRGSVVKTLGDGLMAVFSSAADAVAAAVSMQTSISSGDDGTAPGEEIRIGINSGEVVRDDGDYAGTPVVLAQRLCDLAQGGEIFVAEVVRALVGSRGRFGFVARGARPVKGFDRTVEVWEVDWRGGGKPAPGRQQEIPFPAVLSRVAQAHLVGREEAFARLDATLSRTRAGERQMVMVAGEPGIGKSALTAVWARRASEDGITVLAGRCPSEAVSSYQPFVEAIRPLALARPDLLASAGPGAPELIRLLPDLADRFPHTPKVQAEPGTERYLLFEAVVALVNRLAGEAPVVLLLDDLHWADAPSLTLLEHVARHPDQAPVLLLGTYRDTDLGRSHPLARVLGELRRERRFERIELAGLAIDEVGELVTARAGHGVPGLAVAEIHGETEGNPFFVEEVLAHLLEVGAIDPSGRWRAGAGVDELGIPEGIREVIGRRLERLDEASNRILAVAAVIGRGFDLALLAELTDEPIEELEDRVERAVAAGLLTESGDEIGRFSFSHALIRQTLYEEMLPTRRARTHRRVAEALSAAAAPAAELAHHWSAAQDIPRALAASIQAASDAEAVYAFDDSRRHMDLALELWDDIDGPEAAAGVDRVEILRRAAEMFYLAGDDARAISLIGEAIQLVDISVDAVKAGVLNERRSRYLWVAGKGAPALAAGEEALALIPSQPPSEERARALAAVAGILMLAGRYEEGREVSAQAIAVAREVGARSVEGHALVTLGTVQGMTGEIETGVENIRAGRAIAETEHAVDDLLRSYSNLSSIYDAAGRLRDAVEEGLRGFELSSQFGLYGKYGMFQLANAAASLLRMGEWDEAENLLSYPPSQSPAAVTSMNLNLQRAFLATFRGDFEKAHLVVADLLSQSREAIDPQFVAPTHALAGELAWWEGRWEDTLTHVQEGLKLLEGTDDFYFVAPLCALGLRTLVQLARSQPDRLIEWRDIGEGLLATVVSGPPVSGNVVADAATSRALWSDLSGAPDPDLWAEAVRRWEEIPQVFDVARTKVEMAEALLAVGRSGEVESLLDEASDTAARLSARPLQSRIDALR